MANDPLTQATMILINDPVVLSYFPTLKQLTETTPVMTTVSAVLRSLLIVYGLILIPS